MWNNFKKNITFLFLCGFLLIILKNTQVSITLASHGLNLWYENMIPTLFPFMILSSVLLRTNFSYKLANMIKPILYPIYHLSNDCLYCMVMGFVCGFPMGAKVIADSVDLHRISKKEAQLLLAFCNNIGPTFMLGFIIPLFTIEEISLVFFTMYGIPLIYGILLRYTIFKEIPIKNMDYPCGSNEKLLHTIDLAIHSSITAITTLGGYMIFYNLLMIFPYLIKDKLQPLVYGISCCLTEITGGASILASLGIGYKTILVLLPFGGLSCIAQTYTMIKSTKLSLVEYTIHKIIQSIFVLLFLACLQ